MIINLIYEYSVFVNDIVDSEHRDNAIDDESLAMSRTR